MTAQTLEDHRRALLGIGYRMLGTVADAEDVAQEALLRLHQADPPPDEPRAWLVRVATRLCIDRLREARTRRAAHVGPWLPDFLLAAPDDPAADVAQAESVSIALLIVLESLSPAERAAFVLHDVFDYGYDELAGILDRSEAACRQLVSRARRALRARRPRFEADPSRRLEVAIAFSRAIDDGAMEPLVAVLSEDVTLRADAGGRRPSPRRPLEGPPLVARFLLGVRAKGGRGAVVEPVLVNGSPGAVIVVGGVPDSIYALEVGGGRVGAVHVLRDPDRVRAALAHRGAGPMSDPGV